MKRIFLALISLLLCFSLVCILSSCQEKKYDLTQDFHEFYHMPTDQMVFNSGFNARLFSIKRENADKPKIIIDMCAVYNDADSFYQTTYDWMCIETEVKKENLRKYGECFEYFAKEKRIKNYHLYLVFHTSYGQDIYDYQTGELWVSKNYNILKETYQKYKTFNMNELKSTTQGKEFYIKFFSENSWYDAKYTFSKKIKIMPDGTFTVSYENFSEAQ